MTTRRTEDEWRLVIQNLRLQREQREHHSFRELIAVNESLTAEVKLLRQQLSESHAFVVLEDDLAAGAVVSAAAAGGGAASTGAGADSDVSTGGEWAGHVAAAVVA